MNLYKKKPFQRHFEHFLGGYREEKGRESPPAGRTGLPNNKIPTPVCPLGRASSLKPVPEPTDDVIDENVDCKRVTLVRAFGSYPSNQIRAKGSHQRISISYCHFNLCVLETRMLGLGMTGFFSDCIELRLDQHLTRIEKL